MKPVGETLENRRKEKKFTLEDVHKFIKIHPKFLEALEKGDYSVFSDGIHAKGFLKIYADFLDLDVNQMLAFWRREYEDQFEKGSEKKKKFELKKLEPTRLLVTPGLILTIIISVLILSFFGYLSYQYRNYSGAPKIEIFSPQNSIVVNSEILDVTGKTDMDSVLLINNQRVVIDTDGSFVTSIKLRPGLNTLSFLVVNKLGRETEEIRTIIFREIEVDTKDTPNEKLDEVLGTDVSESTPSDTLAL